MKSKLSEVKIGGSSRKRAWSKELLLDGILTVASLAFVLTVLELGGRVLASFHFPPGPTALVGRKVTNFHLGKEMLTQRGSVTMNISLPSQNTHFELLLSELRSLSALESSRRKLTQNVSRLC